MQDSLVAGARGARGTGAARGALLLGSKGTKRKGAAHRHCLVPQPSSARASRQVERGDGLTVEGREDIQGIFWRERKVVGKAGRGACWGRDGKLIAHTFNAQRFVPCTKTLRACALCSPRLSLPPRGPSSPGSTLLYCSCELECSSFILPCLDGRRRPPLACALQLKVLSPLVTGLLRCPSSQPPCLWPAVSIPAILSTVGSMEQGRTQQAPRP